MAIEKKSVVNLRPLTYKDIDPILAMWWSPIIEKEKIAANVGGRPDMSLIAEAEGHLVGFMLARDEYLGMPIDEVCVIHSIVVKPEYRSLGIARTLINELRNQCAKKGIKTIRALVPQANQQLMEYMKRLGFQPSNVINLDLNCL